MNYLFSKLGSFRKVVFFLLAVFLALSLVRNIQKIRKANEKIDNAEKKLEDLNKESLLLQKKLKEVESTNFIEKEARDKLGLAKEGEIVLILPEDEVLRKLSPKEGSEEEILLTEENWKEWFKLFF